MTYYLVSSIFMEEWTEFDNAEKESAHFSLEAWERLFGGDRELNGRDMIEVNSFDGQKIYTVGIPYIASNDNEKQGNILYLPGISYSIDENMMGSFRVIRREEIPDATSITLKVDDPDFHQIDYKEELEKILSSKAILEIGDILEVFGFIVSVVDLQPCERVFCDGEEVEILFEQPPVSASAPASAPASIPVYTPDLAAEHTPPATTTGFVPFSGKGYRLGD